jgi:hypothetical protein
MAVPRDRKPQGNYDEPEKTERACRSNHGGNDQTGAVRQLLAGEQQISLELIRSPQVISRNRSPNLK